MADETTKTETKKKSLQTFKLSDLEEGKIELESQRRGSGSFAKIREMAAKHLKKEGDACTYYNLVKVVEIELSLGSPQQAYNYVRNALKSDKRFDIKKVKDRSVIVRVA